MHLHYTVDSLYKWEGWMVTREDDEAFGYIANQGDNLCPLGLNGGWEYQLSSGNTCLSLVNTPDTFLLLVRMGD